MKARTKLVLCGAVIAATVGFVVYLGASSSWQYYLLVDECAALAEELPGKRLRVSGSVAVGTLRVADDRRAASFVLAGNAHRLPVSCVGSLPDNLAEGMDVVVEGTWQREGRLHGQRVITRCASKYAPAEAPRPVGAGQEAVPQG